jgi:hypothetical protein
MAVTLLRDAGYIRRSSRVVQRMASMLLIRNGSMMVLIGMLLRRAPRTRYRPVFRGGEKKSSSKVVSAKLLFPPIEGDSCQPTNDYGLAWVHIVGLYLCES